MSIVIGPCNAFLQPRSVHPLQSKISPFPPAHSPHDRAAHRLHDHWHEFHHDDESLGTAYRLDRFGKWSSCELAWHAERCPLRQSMMQFQDLPRFKSDGWLNNFIMQDYTDLIVQRSLEDPRSHPVAFQLTYPLVLSRSVNDARYSGMPILVDDRYD